MSGECEEKETFDVMINVLSQGRVTLYFANHVKFVYGKKSVLVLGIFSSFKINVLN